MSAADGPISDRETDRLFSRYGAEPAIVLAVSGGPDSTALMYLAARWRARREAGPHLFAVTVDHALRPESRREAAAVKRLAATLGVPHRTARWQGEKPRTGIQERARAARYGLLGLAARRVGARLVLTAHTIDDQAETIMYRLARGSGPAGLAGMTRRVSFEDLGVLVPPPSPGTDGEVSRPVRASLWLDRPLLDLPKARLIATLRGAGIAFVDDPSNADPRFTRARWRTLMPLLAAEGLTAARLNTLAVRLRRAEAAIDDLLRATVERFGVTAASPVRIDAATWRGLPDEIALRLVGLAVRELGHEGPVELGKLEVLVAELGAAIDGAMVRFRRTLAGAMVSLHKGTIHIGPAPPRRQRAPPPDAGRRHGPPAAEPVFAPLE